MKSRLYLWILLITHSGPVCGEVEFLEQLVGESVVFPCVCKTQSPSPIGVYLKRKWLNPEDVLFMYTKEKPSPRDKDDDRRITVIGDPADYRVNVTISQLRTSDTDRYYCEFVIKDIPEDRKIPGQTEFLLYVHDDVPVVVEIGQIETCAGGSAVLPCLPPHGDTAAMEGVTLKRRKGRAPVEMLYHSKYHHNNHHAASSASSSSSAPSSLFPSERLVLSTTPGPRGMVYNLTLLRLRPEDSALYACQLLVPGRPDSSSSLGRRVFFVSVQGGPCGCSSYETLLYAMSAAAALLLVLIVVALVAVYKGKARDRVKPQPPGAIYEEMVGVRPPSRKVAPCHLDNLHLEETDCSTYSNSQVTFRTENHYEKTSSTCSPMDEEEK